MLIISDNTALATLSTIAQTTAALFAFLGAFVLFRLQSSDSQIQMLARSLADRTTREGRRDRLLLLVASRMYSDAMSSLAHASGHAGEIGESYRSLHNELAALEKIRRSFGFSIVPALFLTLTSVLGMPFVEYTKSYQTGAQIILGMLLAAFVAVFFLLARVLHACMTLIDNEQ